MKRYTSLFLILVGIGASVLIQQHLLALSIILLGLFILLSDNSFNDIPPKRESGKYYPPASDIKEYRKENPGTSISQAIKQLIAER